jgi:hypothetical protein
MLATEIQDVPNEIAFYTARRATSEPEHGKIAKYPADFVSRFHGEERRLGAPSKELPLRGCIGVN